jgi:hypothetical protein
MTTIKLVWPDDELADVDRVRGSVPRERWIRDLCRAAVVARDAFDGPCFIRLKATGRDVPQQEGVVMFEALDD